MLLNSFKPIHPDSIKLRFNWNAGIAQDPFDASTIYYGSQYLHKSVDRGNSWQIISPDLTTNDTTKQEQRESGGLTYDVTAAENFTTILSIDISILNRNIIWVGTDDGNIQVTMDGGKNWENCSLRLKDLPEGSWIAQVHASIYNEKEAFIVANNYRRGDWNPYIYQTKDLGKKWKRIVSSDQVWGYTLSFVQDIESPNLYFLGTEFGLYMSFDAGKNWNRWKEGYPSVSTMDMKIHPRDGELIIGTFGRGVYIFDDIHPLREIASSKGELLEKYLHIFDPPKGYIATYSRPLGTRFAADAIYSGKNKPYGINITYWI